jgi:[acyl-carrier-protein] S-malonyltransferase
MGSIAYLFPGQGSQYVGMGKDLVSSAPEARDIFARADSVLGVPLSTICFDGPEDELRQTRNTQPAIFLHSMALAALLPRHSVTMVAGHSLGEYSALVFAGAMSFEDGLRLVRLRGELMQRAGEEQHGTMAAVVGLEPSVVDQLCGIASADGIVQCANFNSPGQIVISGSVSGVQRAMALAKAGGARLVKELVVSGAFHSPLMQSAREGLRSALATSEICDARIPVYANVTAAPVRSASEIRRLLEEQLTSPVRWEEIIRSMAADGATTFVEIGPGKVLQGLVKRTHEQSIIKGVDKFTDIGILTLD